MLTACNNNEEVNNENVTESASENTVGFEVLGDKIEKAADVPEKEEKQNTLRLLMNILQPLMKRISIVIQKPFLKIHKVLNMRKILKRQKLPLINIILKEHLQI